MTRFVPLHPDDAATLQDLRVQLRDLRRAEGISGYELCRRLGQHLEFVSRLENGVTQSPNMSTLQMWARGLDRRLEFVIPNFWLMAHRDHDMLAKYAESRPWDSYPELLRAFVMAAARQARVRRRIDAVEMAALLNVEPDSVRAWEDRAVADPAMSRVMWHFRHCGFQLSWQLFTKDEWIYG